MARCQDDAHVWLVRRDPLRKSKTVHRPCEVDDAEDDMNRYVAMLQDCEGFIRIDRLVYLEAALAQILRQDEARQHLVLDDKDGGQHLAVVLRAEGLRV